MPDALYQAAEQLAPAPARTNFFDPAAGQDIISRYANTRRAGAGLDALGKAASGYAADQLRAEDQQLQRETAERNKTIFDRDTAAYNEQQGFKTERGDFLSKIAGLDPLAPDYQTTVGELISGVPEVAMKDDAVQAILHAKNSAWEDAQRTREREQYRQDVRKERDADMDQRHAVRLASLGLKPDEFVFDPQTGDLDVIASTAKAVEKKGSVRDVEKELGAAEKDIKTAISDQDAFPSQKSNFIRQYGASDTGEPNKAKSPLEYQKALEYDSNQFDSELNSARNMTLGDYLKAVPGLKPAQQAKRKALWEHANQSAEAPVSPAAAAAAKVRKYNPATGKIE